VDAGSRFETLRLIWDLLPLNVGELVQAVPLGVALPDDCLIVFLDSDAWQSDPVIRTLLAHSQRVKASGAALANGFDSSRLVAFRYRHAH
jgi:hypothetical protein